VSKISSSAENSHPSAGLNRSGTGKDVLVRVGITLRVGTAVVGNGVGLGVGDAVAVGVVVGRAVGDRVGARVGVLVEVGEGMDVGVELDVDVAVSVAVGVRVAACATAVPEASEVATWDTVATSVGVTTSS
jgi:hypothetical protein